MKTKNYDLLFRLCGNALISLFVEMVVAAVFLSNSDVVFLAIASGLISFTLLWAIEEIVCVIYLSVSSRDTQAKLHRAKRIAQRRFVTWVKRDGFFTLGLCSACAFIVILFFTAWIMGWDTMFQGWMVSLFD